MGIDAKDVCFITWKILRFSTNLTFRCMKAYPVVSGVSVFTIFLYAFLPWVFYFLLCFSPFMAYASFYLRNSKIGDLSEEDKRLDRGLSKIAQEEITKKAELKNQRSVRRNARRKVEEVGKDWDSSQASEDERGKVILKTLYGEVLPETITPDLETLKRKRTFLVPEESSFDSELDNDVHVVELDSLARLNSIGGGETELECSSSSSSSQEEEKEEEEGAEEEKETKVVVAWTEDDQKNLMDLGTSEIERNKRLENLISRRRSRRFFLLATEGSLMDMEVPRICVGRNLCGFDQENYEINGLFMPGSAPSVLPPRRNPFDLPYDPLEEKPNLTGDSFQKEFAETNPKDIFFCRHGSFHHRNFPSIFQKEAKLAKEVDGRPSPLQGSNDQAPLMKERDLTTGEGNDMETGEAPIETDSIRNYTDSNRSLSPRDREKDINVSDQSDASVTFCKQNCRVGNSLAGLVPRSRGSSSLASARQRYMEHFGYSMRKYHMVSHSVDSDLQVEVSELGSPPTSVDGNDSDEERSLFVQSESRKEMDCNGVESEILPVDKDDEDVNETLSLASPEKEEGMKLEPLDLQFDEAFSKGAEELKELPKNSADEIKISYDSDEPEQSDKTDQESEDPCERNNGEKLQQLAEADASDVNHHVNSEESVTCSGSMLLLPDMLHLDHTHSKVLNQTLDGQLQNVDPSPEESSHSQGSEVTFNNESNSAEDHVLSIDPLAEELKNNQTD